MNARKVSILAAIAMLLCMVLAQSSTAAVKLHPLFCDHVVLQQGKDMPVYGTAAAGERVEVTFQGKTASAEADKEGNWKVTLGKFEAGGPFDMTVKGVDTVTIKDILIGEVWVASGQSNMAIGVQSCVNGPQEAMAADFPRIRMFNVGQVLAHKPQRSCYGAWSVCSPGTANEYSAVAFFFARELHKAIKTPVGIINSSIGATPAEAWTSVDGFADPVLAHYRKEYEQNFASITQSLEGYFKDLDAWKAQSLVNAKEGNPVQHVPPIPAQFGDWRQPCGLYNGMIAPLTGFPIRGVIWYQGEGNTGKTVEHRTLFPALIKDWRQKWGEEFPFLFVQLCNYGHSAVQVGESNWAELRESQAMTLKLPKTAMAVTIDIGEGDIHPRNKQDMGARLALAAQAIVHGQDVVYIGPTYNKMTVQGGKVRLEFTNLGGGLTTQSGKTLIPRPEVKDTPLAGSELKRFEIAGADKKFVWANAKTDGDTVLVWSESVPNPVAVRFCWADNPDGCNLYSKAGLPAGPFRTDNWEPGK